MGASQRTRPGVSESLSGLPVVRSRPYTGCSRATNISRACTCGSATISATLLTGAAGTPAPESTRTISAFGRVPVQPWMIAAISSRRSRRAAAVAKAGSRVSSSRPMTAQKRAQIALLAEAATATWPSAAG